MRSGFCGECWFARFFLVWGKDGFFCYVGFGKDFRGRGRVGRLMVVFRAGLCFFR